MFVLEAAGSSCQLPETSVSADTAPTRACCLESRLSTEEEEVVNDGHAHKGKIIFCLASGAAALLFSADVAVKIRFFVRLTTFPFSCWGKQKTRCPDG